MRRAIGIWDAIFGKKITIDLPMPDGKIKKVQVSERWFAQMERQGLVKPIGGQTIEVHILDPAGEIGAVLGLSAKQATEVGLPSYSSWYRTERWEVGRDISVELYHKMKDQKTGDLFALISIKDGERKPLILPHEIWLEAKRNMDQM